MISEPLNRILDIIESMTAAAEVHFALVAALAEKVGLLLIEAEMLDEAEDLRRTLSLAADVLRQEI